MNCFIKPVKLLKGRFFLPASKSYSIRAFIIAACGGESIITHPSNCDDSLVASEVIKFLGAKVKKAKNNIWQIKVNPNIPKFSQMYVKESGTVLRFMLPLAASYGQPVTLTGSGTLHGRPNAFLNTTLRSMGVDIKGVGPKESIPVTIKGGQLSGGKYSINGSLSSQFISALLITCPRLEKDTQLTLTGKKLVSSDYITMTLQVLKKAGIRVASKGEREFSIKGKQKFAGLKNFTVPSDYGLAAFSLAAAALVPSTVVLDGHLDNELIQADGHIINFLKKMGVRFTKTSKSITIKGPFELKGGRFSLKDCPDLVPIMAVLALFAKGKTELVDIEHARAKESDRISDLRSELLKIGAKINESKTSLTIIPQKIYKSNMLLDPHRDHRLAMAFSVLGVRVGVYVKDIECTAKSYPDFVNDMKSIGFDFQAF